ncbi:hypothetical protein N9A10_00205 [Candidatus Pelagibacter sp.]|nr:hypothetical protein [Candidatus Pelagibacter sp.]
MNKIVLIIIFIILNSCGYKAFYSNKNINFNIINIKKLETNKLNNIFEKRIKNFSNGDAIKQIVLEIDSKKNISIVSKDSMGNPSRYQMTVRLNLKITDDQDKKVEKEFFKQFDYNSNSNKFALSQYEKDIQIILIEKVTEEVIKYLSKF